MSSLELAAAGVGIHHAGLSVNDRRTVEDLYMKMVLKVVIATSVCCICMSSFSCS